MRMCLLEAMLSQNYDEEGKGNVDAIEAEDNPHDDLGLKAFIKSSKRHEWLNFVVYLEVSLDQTYFHNHAEHGHDSQNHLLLVDSITHYIIFIS